VPLQLKMMIRLARTIQALLLLLQQLFPQTWADSSSQPVEDCAPIAFQASVRELRQISARI
jgi:hypothetical protein